MISSMRSLTHSLVGSRPSSSACAEPPSHPPPQAGEGREGVGAVHHLGGPRRRHRKGKADDAGEPLVEIVLVLRLLCLNDFGRGLARHELGAPAPGEVACELGVPVILELLDLVRRPALRHADQGVGDGAFGEVIELPELAAQRDVDGHQHLLHRRIAVDAVGAHVARPVDDVARRVVDRRHALEHLLVGRRVDDAAVIRSEGLRRAAPIVDHALDGGAVELLQRAELARPRAPAIKRCGVDHEHVFE